jgi:DNA/RNA-binding domain of Phe-tRNA-synthetase-like protein
MGLSESTVQRWVAQAEVDGGQRDGLTTAEREELSHLRREMRVVREERDVLAKAIALFAHGVTPLYAQLSGSWLNMVKSVQRIVIGRALSGGHPTTAVESSRGWRRRWLSGMQLQHPLSGMANGGNDADGGRPNRLTVDNASAGLRVAHPLGSRQKRGASVKEPIRDAERSVRDRLEIATLAEHPQIRAWRKAYRAFGAKPAEFRSSIEAMARRAVRGDQPLPSISRLVHIGNVVSLRHLVPVGGRAIDVLTQDIELRPARGDEVFVAFGSDLVEHPLPGEIVFVERSTVLTRRWTWRQAEHTHAGRHQRRGAQR